MPRPTARLDVFLIPADPTDGAVDAARALLATWSDGLPAGAQDARLDDPGAPVLYANRIGGFRARCRVCGTSVAGALRPHGETPCGGCGRTLAFDQVECSPPAHIGRAAAVLIDVQTPEVAAPPGFVRVLARV